MSGSFFGFEERLSFFADFSFVLTDLLFFGSAFFVVEMTEPIGSSFLHNCCFTTGKHKDNSLCSGHIKKSPRVGGQYFELIS
jgi:hypothetical protein